MLCVLKYFLICVLKVRETVTVLYSLGKKLLYFILIIFRNVFLVVCLFFLSRQFNLILHSGSCFYSTKVCSDTINSCNS